ncbi:hypothetical protein RRG08_062352 [Elysia crispata]|uniref:Uncharacterized protein n=1 Tax=Elysia crispata TaxID=231223 RepID=A0AAE0YGF8_9GAST|nr:hypothetical protein RRG08_062352 [Elysia crispata]
MRGSSSRFVVDRVLFRHNGLMNNTSLHSSSLWITLKPVELRPLEAELNRAILCSTWSADSSIVCPFYCTIFRCGALLEAEKRKEKDHNSCFFLRLGSDFNFRLDNWCLVLLAAIGPLVLVSCPVVINGKLVPLSRRHRTLTFTSDLWTGRSHDPPAQVSYTSVVSYGCGGTRQS